MVCFHLYPKAVREKDKAGLTKKEERESNGLLKQSQIINIIMFIYLISISLLIPFVL